MKGKPAYGAEGQPQKCTMGRGGYNRAGGGAMGVPRGSQNRKGKPAFGAPGQAKGGGRMAGRKQRVEK